MRPLVVDKIASVTKTQALGREVRVGEDFPCRAGDIIAVRVLTEKSTYNTVELSTGRMSLIKKGDVVVGALGHRNALAGYTGKVPTSLACGDTVNILNLGGVIGECTGFNPQVGRPFECEVLGQVLHFPVLGERVGIPATILNGRPPMRPTVEAKGVPFVLVVGTCMDSGKTYASASLIQELTRRRLVVDAFKATGVSLYRDVLAMEDAGARRTMIFTDLGVVTTCEETAPGLARTMLSELADGAPDIVLAELGDGILGTYGVHSILADEAIRAAVGAVVLASSDPVGAWGGAKRLQEEYGILPHVITGPCTDNAAGSKLVEEKLGIPAANARSAPNELAEHVLKALGLGSSR